jgi:pimeloyl-ACP methyl ester carboxylesterase
MSAPADIWWAAADGGRLHALDWPGPADKMPILGLPGLTRTAFDFAPLAGWIAGRRRVIGVDLRGRGRSEHDPDPMRYAMPVYVEDIDRLLDALALDRVLLAGGSNGGVLAALYAAHRPDRVAGLLFDDVAHRFEEAGFARIRSQLERGVRWDDWQDAAAALETRYGAIHPRYGAADWSAFARRTLREADDGSIVPGFDERILIPLEAPGGPPNFDLLPIYRASAHIPSLLLRGALSDLLSEAAVVELAEALPLLEYATVPDVGHLPDLAEPESVAAIERWLARVDAEDSRSGVAA